MTEDKKDELEAPWSRLGAWMEAFCVVTFDLELGQAMELIYPSRGRLSEQDSSSVCYLAFPDSNSGCMGDTQFHFRFRTAASAPGDEPSYLYGYVHFRQVRDPSLPRGYFQKSVILLSSHPFVNLFLEVCGMVAPEYFAHGSASIEAACRNIDQWPIPSGGSVVALPLLGTVVRAQLPGTEGVGVSLGSVLPSAPPAPIPAVVDPASLFRCFSALLPHVHTLWELVLTAEPIVVMAASPETCSQVVHGLVSMIFPLRYCGEHRPYFTIHDAEFREYTRPAQPPPAAILGVTNPFFAKTLQHWPHVIRLDPAQHPKAKLRRTPPKPEAKAGVYSKYEPFLQKDKALLKKLLRGIQTGRPEEVQGALMRRHLLELTQSFMMPLERYMSTLMPLHRSISAFGRTPSPLPFRSEEFLGTLARAGPQLTTGVRGDWTGLYRRFLRSSNFSGWLRSRLRAMADHLAALHTQALSDADVAAWVRGRREVEVVDLLLKIRSKLAESRAGEPVVEKLRKQMDDIMESLPEDTRAALRSSPTS